MHLESGPALLVIAGGAALLPIVARRIKVLPMVAEILFGIILSFLGFRNNMSGNWLPFLAHFGFLMLMFHAGLEIDFQALRREKPFDILICLFIYCLTLTMAYGAALLLGHGLFLALVFSTTSLDLALSALRELKLSKTPFGQSVLLCATLADFLTLLGLTVFVLYSDLGFSAQLFKPLPIFFVFALALWGLRLLAWWYPHQATKLLGGSDPLELGVRAVLALLFIFVGLSELVGMEPILGAFLGGCVLSIIFEDRGLVEEKLAGFAYGFLIPIFFINVGLQFPTEALLRPDFLFLSGKLLVIALLVKLLPSFLLRFRGLSYRSCFSAGILLSARLSLIIASASIGVEKGLIPKELEPSILGLALITAAACPIIFRRLAPDKNSL
ncbi:MAG: cation:proton antiporter [Desulfobulbaceae bacterium]|nr:cation:proton antiporter [Desulfobulbaceae bacterium]